MALVQYNIHYDPTTGKEVVHHQVVQLGGPDRVFFTTDYKGTTLQFANGSPFGASVPKTISISNAKGQLMTANFEVENAGSFHADCGEVDGTGKFKKWPGNGVEFP